ncbi:DNA-binding protein, partial [Bacillus cereus]
VLALGVVFIIAGLLRFLNFPIPAIVIALISVMAAFLSLSDLLETNKIKGVSTATQILALISFVALMIVWLFFRNVDYSFIPIIGDGFTVIGLG